MQNADFSSENVLVITFGDDANNDKNAYLALTDLKELDSQHQIKLAGGAVVAREPDGRVEVKAEIGPDGNYEGAATGGLIGLLVGILGGPLGILLGGTTGLLVGTLFDADDADMTVSVLGDISKQVQVERTALLAQVIEPSHEVIDVAMSRFGATVLRRPLAEVEAEIAAAQDAERVAKREARKELQRAHLEQHKQDVQTRVAELKSKLHRPKALA